MASRSPNFNLDSYFWEYAKDVAYQTTLTTRDDMIARVRRACRAVAQQTLQGVMQNFKRRHCA